jgi:acetolactate synthase regulatory subunit
MEAARLGIEILVQAREALELLGNLVAKLIDPLGIVAAQRFAEFVPADIEWR